jgi:preprotein translocase subunit SecA
LAKQKMQEGDEHAKQEELTKSFLSQFRQQVQKEHEQVIGVGGLHVLGTERHEARRIDNQLRGRAGRQGDPGSSKFFVSLEDDLMRLFASDRIMSIMDKLGMEEGQVIEHPWVSRAIEVAQKRVETHNFEIRKQLLEYDNVMNKQREAIYGLRRSILESDNVKDHIVEAILDETAVTIDQYLFSGKGEATWDVDGLELSLKTRFNFDISPLKDRLQDISPEQLKEEISQEIVKLYDRREQEVPPEQLRQLEKFILLNVIDAKWKDHLYAMDQLREGVGLRSYGQRDPLIEYKREGFGMFQLMFSTINQEVAETIFKVQMVHGPGRAPRGVFSSTPQNFVHNEFSSLSGDHAAGPGAPPPEPNMTPQGTPGTHHKSDPKVGRNDPCPCGSGKKYKKCCGR